MGQVSSIKYQGKLKLIFFVLFFALNTYYLSLNTVSPVFAQIQCNRPNPITGRTDDCPASGLAQAQEILTRIINVSVTIAFMALTVWLVWGALKFFITSGGDPKALSHAWMSVTWAFLGIFFLVLAWLALKLVATFTGAPVTSYCLGFPPYCI